MRVTITEAAKILGLKAQWIHYTRLNFKFPEPVESVRKLGGTVNKYDLDAIINAVENRISLATGLPVNQLKGKQPGHKNISNYYNNGGQYIHYGEYKADKSWPTHRGDEADDYAVGA